MNPQITINVGSGGSAGGYSGSSGALDQGALPTPVMGMGESAVSRDSANLGQADLPSPMTQSASGAAQDAGGLPSPMSQGASGAAQDSGGLPSPMSQGASGAAQDSGGLPSPMAQGASEAAQDSGGLPSPMAQGASGADQADAGLPRPSDKGHLGEHDQVSVSSGSGGGDPMPKELQELMVLIQAEEAKLAQPEPAAEQGPAAKRAKK